MLGAVPSRKCSHVQKGLFRELEQSELVILYPGDVMMAAVGGGTRGQGHSEGAGWSCPRDPFSFSLLMAFAQSSSKSSLGLPGWPCCKPAPRCRLTPTPLVSFSLPPAPSRTVLHSWGHWGGREGVMEPGRGFGPLWEWFSLSREAGHPLTPDLSPTLTLDPAT